MECCDGKISVESTCVENTVEADTGANPAKHTESRHISLTSTPSSSGATRPGGKKASEAKQDDQEKRRGNRPVEPFEQAELKALKPPAESCRGFGHFDLCMVEPGFG